MKSNTDFIGSKLLITLLNNINVKKTQASQQGWKMSGSAGSGAARKFLKELLAGNFLYFAGNFFAHSLL